MICHSHDLAACQFKLNRPLPGGGGPTNQTSRSRSHIKGATQDVQLLLALLLSIMSVTHSDVETGLVLRLNIQSDDHVLSSEQSTLDAAPSEPATEAPSTRPPEFVSDYGLNTMMLLTGLMLVVYCTLPKVAEVAKVADNPAVRTLGSTGIILCSASFVGFAAFRLRVWVLQRRGYGLASNFLLEYEKMGTSEWFIDRFIVSSPHDLLLSSMLVWLVEIWLMAYRSYAVNDSDVRGPAERVTLCVVLGFALGYIAFMFDAISKIGRHKQSSSLAVGPLQTVAEARA